MSILNSPNLYSEVYVDQLIGDYDETFMPLPDIEFEPHLLISKVRKHYMEYMIKMLSANYETNQRLVNKNIYLPSAIWKCAKKMEMKAAQTCMVVQLYRKCIVTMINEVKTDTKKGRLNKKLFESLHLGPTNEKKTQTTVTGENCQCNCNDKKRRRKRSSPPLQPLIEDQPKDNFAQRVEDLALSLQDNSNCCEIAQRIPVVTNMQIDPLPVIVLPQSVDVDLFQNEPKATTAIPAITPKNIELESDDLMQQLEKLFQGDKDDDDLFTSTILEDNTKVPNGVLNTQDSLVSMLNNAQDTIIENHAAQIKSLDARLATLTGLIANSESTAVAATQPQKVIKKQKQHASKWHCEEYFLKKGLFELLYQIGDTNRKKLARIKEMYRHLFGDDSDDEEGIVSPDESPDLVASCKSRIDSWVMSILAPYYVKGRIEGKVLYKSVARHLIELIYKCKQYPSRHEVTSFVLDFLENRGKIRCEADFKEFRIENVYVVPNYSIV